MWFGHIISAQSLTHLTSLAYVCMDTMLRTNRLEQLSVCASVSINISSSIVIVLQKKKLTIVYKLILCFNFLSKSLVDVMYILHV